jgi:hypothetical protein
MPVQNAETTNATNGKTDSKRVNGDYSPIILEERAGNKIYARLNPIDGKKVPADGFIHVATYAAGKTKDGNDGWIVTNPDGLRFNNDAEEKLQLAVLYASRKFVSFEVSRLYGDNAGRQQYKALYNAETAYSDIVSSYALYLEQMADGDETTALDAYTSAMIDEQKAKIIEKLSDKAYGRIFDIVLKRERARAAIADVETESEAESETETDETTNNA